MPKGGRSNITDAGRRPSSAGDAVVDADEDVETVECVGGSGDEALAVVGEVAVGE